MTKRLITLIICLLTLVGVHAQGETVEALLTQLDQYVESCENYTRHREVQIDLLKEQLAEARLRDDSQRIFELSKAIFMQYESYQCDSALSYVNGNIALARQKGWHELLSQSLIHKAHLLSTAGLMVECMSTLGEVPRADVMDESKEFYYMTLRDYYAYCTENTLGTEYTDDYVNKSRLYADSTQLYASEASKENLFSQLYTLTRYDPLQAIELIDSELLHCPSGDRVYSMLMSWKSFAYANMHDEENRLICLIRSAISDVEGAIMENTSFTLLSDILFAKGELERAEAYLKKGLSDAQFFNSRLRYGQAGKLLPKIDLAYQTMKLQQEARLRRNLIIISILFVLLAIASGFICQQMYKLHKAKKRAMIMTQRQHELNSQLKKLNRELTDLNVCQQQTNLQLSEANRIKEEYIVRFMELCSTYIAGFETYRKRLTKLAAPGKLPDLVQQLRSEEITEESYKTLYLSFDKAFVKLFPDFFTQVNALLPPEEAVELKRGDRLNTELRILALIRLGITDSEKMASFLRSSITTIYTYRSKLKNRALNPATFENDIMNISAVL